MANVEGQAVAAVSTIFGRCPRLMAELASNDKTPFTDGFIYVYSSEKQSNATAMGRVPVQIKGRTHTAKIKETADTIQFGIDRVDLEFFKQDGGVLYFFVPVSPDGYAKGVFYEALTPFRINRLLDKMKPGQKSLNVKLKRFTDNITEVQNLTGYALEARKQASTRINVDEVLPQLTSLTVRSRTQIHDDRPTELKLEESDFFIEGTMAGGSIIPLDMDIMVYPGEYIPEPMEIDISCGGVVYEKPVRQQIDSDNARITLSDGLTIRVQRDSIGLKTNIDLSAEGTVFDQLKDLSFFLAAARGEPLHYGDMVMPPLAPNVDDRRELEFVRARIQEMVEALGYLDLGSELARSIPLGLQEKQYLVMLHDALLAKEDIPTHESGRGRMNVLLGDYQVVVLVSEGTKEDHRRIIDPFHPENRGDFRILREGEDGKPEEIEWATIYEALHEDDFGRTLNLHVDHIAEAYDALEDRNVALSIANQFLLNLLHAADKADAPMRAYLLRGAGNLSDWLVEKGDGDVLYNINQWQVWYRRAPLAEETEREIRAARRKLRESSTPDTHFKEACLTILLRDFDELDSLIESFTADDVARISGWPIWALRTPSSSVELPENIAPSRSRSGECTQQHDTNDESS